MAAFITYPLMWFAALALPALISIYFLHHRYKRRRVSSLMLWAEGRQLSSGGQTLKRFSFPWIFLLELLILALLIFAGLDWRYTASRKQQRIVIILDNSISMQARHSDGLNSHNAALRSLKNLISNPKFKVARTVIAGTELTPVESQNPSDLLARITERWNCLDHNSSLSQAVTSLKRTHPAADLVVMTDQPPPEGSPVTDGTMWFAFGEAGENLAIVSAVRSPGSATQARCLVEVANCATEQSTAEINWIINNKTVHSESVIIPAGSQKTLERRFSAPSEDISVKIANSDALPADNSACLIPPPPRDLRIMLALSNPDLRKIVINTVKATKSAYIVTRNPELFITDTPPPAALNAQATLQIIKSPDMLSCSGPFIIDTSHPLTDGLSLDSLIWAASTNATPRGTALIAAGDIPLLTVDRPNRNRTDISMQLDLSRSNIHMTPAWPVLFWNLTNWRLSERSGFTTANYHTGMPFEIKAPHNLTVSITDPSGKTVELSARGGKVQVSSRQPGIYTATINGNTSRASLNILSPEESDLRKCKSGSWGRFHSDPALTTARSSTAPWLALTALILLFVHHRLISPRLRQGGLA